MQNIKHIISAYIVFISAGSIAHAILTSLPMELIKIIFCDVITSDTREELKIEYHLLRCKKARNLLTLCKRFYTSEQLHHALIASIIEEYGVFSPIYTCAYINTLQSKQWLFHWLLKDPKNKEHAIKLWGRQYQKDTFDTSEFAKQKHMLRTLMAVGFPVDQKDLYKTTLLIKTCKHGDTKMEDFLIACGANKDIVDPQRHNAQYYKNLRTLSNSGSRIAPRGGYFSGDI